MCCPQEFLDGLADAQRHEDDLYHTVSAEHFGPVGSPDIVELPQADAGLFQGRKRQPDWQCAHEERRLFAAAHGADAQAGRDVPA